jgi:hypothetical protein
MGRPCDASLRIPYGGVAQLGEHLLCKQGVVGSIPSASTKVFWAAKQKHHLKNKVCKRQVLYPAVACSV